MTTISAQQLWQRLQDHGLVSGEMPAAGALASPWYVRVMMGTAGWIGALFLLGFVGAAFTFVMASASALLLGAMGCGAALVIFRVARDNDFGTQFGLAVSLASQALFLFGLGKAFKFDGALVYVIAFGFEAALTLLAPNFIHRTLTSFAAMVALSFALGRVGMYGIAPGLVAAGFAMICLSELRGSARVAILRPIGYGLALALLYFDASHGWEHDILNLISPAQSRWLLQYARWAGVGLVGAAFLWVVAGLLAHEEIALASTKGSIAIVAAIVIGALSFIAPGMASAFLILLLGFAAGNRVLIGLGLFALLGFLSHYYYQLQTTLLIKSMVLALSGSMLLLTRLALQKWLPAPVGEGDSDA